MGGSSKSQTVGYRYYLGMHLAICHGPVDAITEIQVGERQAWSGNLTASGRITVNMPELFGGEKREGGISGAIDAAFGQASQTPNDYLVSKIGSPQPAYRGVLSLILRQLYIAANNPYIKPWAVRLKRCFRDWYSAKAEINGAANPAHIVYECLTNAAWGMGYPTASIDDASFRAAADVLSNEGFGLNMIWLQQSKIEQFVKEVMDHIGGVLTTSPSTGRFVLKLVRADYTVATLPILNPDNVIELESFQRAAWGETTNEIVLIYTKPDTFKETSIAVQALANIQAQGAVVSQTRRYPGITSDNLAARVAMRDLASVSTPLAKVRLKVNRKAWNLYPGDVFKLEWPALGIAGLVMRIAGVDGGSLTNGAISIDAVEDVFGLPSAVYTASQPTGWTDPVPAPSATTPRRLVEASYWDAPRPRGAELRPVQQDELGHDLQPARPRRVLSHGGARHQPCARSDQHDDLQRRTRHRSGRNWELCLHQRRGRPGHGHQYDHAEPDPDPWRHGYRANQPRSRQPDLVRRWRAGRRSDRVRRWRNGQRATTHRDRKRHAGAGIGTNRFPGHEPPAKPAVPARQCEDQQRCLPGGCQG